MNSLKQIFGIALVTVLISQATGQPQPVNVKEKIQALEFMTGNWSGGGWMMTQEAGRVEFTQKEVIDWDLNGSILKIGGQGWNSEGKMIHNAFAVIAFDSMTDEFYMHSFLEDGRQTKANFELIEDGKIKWWFKPVPEQPAVIEYLITISDNTWTENGKYSPDGNQWFPFIEFTLTKD